MLFVDLRLSKQSNTIVADGGEGIAVIEKWSATTNLENHKPDLDGVRFFSTPHELQDFLRSEEDLDVPNYECRWRTRIHFLKAGSAIIGREDLGRAIELWNQKS
jgi:hypothetical protein